MTQQRKNSPAKTPRKATREYTTHIETYVPKQDPDLVYRIVGYVEYRNALECFDGLVRYCSEEELRAFDALIQERGEFEIEVNLSRSLKHLPSTLDEQPRGPNDDFRRRGLRWVTGLARAELSAMQLGFAARRDAFQRFAVAFDSEAYTNTVLDGMRAHYWTLLNDADLNVVLSGKAKVDRTLAYFRRLLVARGFLEAGVFLAKEKFTPQQQQELLTWKAKLNKVQAVLAERIRNYRQHSDVIERR